MNEVWKPVVGFEGMYTVSNLGQVKSLARILSDGRRWKEKILKSPPNGSGRSLVGLYCDGIRYNRFVHHLVADAFLGPRSEGLCVNHKNGNPRDNKLENLEYMTSKENSHHAATVLHSFPVGEQHHNARFTTEQIKEVRQLWQTGQYKQRDLAARYGVTQRAVWQVIHRITWAHVP